MKVQASIHDKLVAAFEPVHLDVINESNQHNVPPGSESHFKVVVVSEKFSGKLPVARHKLIYGTLSDELAGSVHALSIHSYTSGEWKARGGEFPSSPPCMGGSKADT